MCCATGRRQPRAQAPCDPTCLQRQPRALIQAPNHASRPAVTIAARKLYISNGQVSCGKGAACEGEAAAALPLVRRVTQSLAAGAPQ